MTDTDRPPRRAAPAAAPAAQAPQDLPGGRSVVAAALGVGLFTSIGTNKNSGPPQAGRPGAVVLAPLGSTGRARSRSRPTAGAEARRRCCCSSASGARCARPSSRRWRPPSGTRTRRWGGAEQVHVIGVDSDDTHGSPVLSFVESRGIGFPVAYDPDSPSRTATFYFQGDPYAVFVKGDGTIERDRARPHFGGQVHRRREEAHSQRKLRAAASGAATAQTASTTQDRWVRRIRRPRRRGGRPRAPRPGGAWPPLPRHRATSRWGPPCPRGATRRGRGRSPRPG